MLTQHLFHHGQEVKRSQGALTSEYQYDEQGRLTQHAQLQQQSQHKFHQGTRASVKQQRQYQYDVAGNLTQVTDSLKGDRQYHYDPLARLSHVRGNIDEHFQHDPAGHLLSQTLGKSSGPAPASAQVKHNRLAFQGDSHFEYDEFGNLVKEKRGKGQQLVTHYHYDCQHRLIKAEMANGTTAHYQYDAFGRRVKKSVTDQTQQTTTEFIWQADRLIAETDNQQHYQSYLYEPGSFKPLALIKGEANVSADPVQVYYYQLDQLGTPQEITDQQGNTVWSVHYRAYGNVLKQEIEQVHSPLRFQGQYYDAETGLHYNRHRYYNPNTAAFLTLDPIGLAGGLNNYQYVPNPTGWVDPLGLAKKPGKAGKCRPKPTSNREFETRAEAEAAIFEKANIDIDTPPDAQWEVGNDVYRKGHDGYLYSTDKGTWGTYRQYETENGSRVIVEHTGEEWDHFHVGVPKKGTSRSSVDFGWGGDIDQAERYLNEDSHHYYSQIVLDPKIREDRGLNEININKLNRMRAERNLPKIQPELN